MSYRRILERADRFFHHVAESKPEHFQCTGCSLCCYGLFEIGAGDVPMLAQGLEQIHPRRRQMIVRRSEEIIKSTDHPDIRECPPSEKEAFFQRTASTTCPNLDDAGRCMLYDHRPLVCRTFGLPLREGARYIGDLCDLNFTTASPRERFDASWDLQWEDELDPLEEYTIPEAIVLIARVRGWL